MSSTLQMKRGTRAQLDALAIRRGLNVGEPFLITDENRQAVATSTTTYTAMALQSEGGGGGGGAVWGAITGTLSSQTDLQTELNKIAQVNTSSIVRSFALMGA